MTRSQHFDDSELRNLQVDLEHAPKRIQWAARKTLHRAGKLLNKGMREDAAGHLGNWFGKPGTSYVTPLPEHVSDEMRGPWEVEVGIENKGAGKLAHIIVYGSVNNAPVYDHTAVLRRNRAAIEEMFGNDVEQSTLGGEK